MASRIRRWKNIAPKEKTRSESFYTMSDDKYQRLFDCVQKKRKGKWTKKKHNSTIKSQQFIDKEKLFREMNIF